MHNRKNSRTATLKKKNRRSRRCFCKNPNVLSCLIPLAVALLITVLLSTWRPMSPREGKRLLPRTPHSPPVVLKTLADRWTSSSLCGARPPKLMSKQRNSPPVQYYCDRKCVMSLGLSWPGASQYYNIYHFIIIQSPVFCRPCRGNEK